MEAAPPSLAVLAYPEMRAPAASPALAPRAAPPLSRTKREVLHCLARRPWTVSELSRVLGLDRAAVYRHLLTLAEQGLVERRASHRKWVYYDLTPPGRSLVDPASGSRRRELPPA